MVASDLKSQLNSDGFVVLDNFLRPEEVELLKKEATKLIDNIPEKETSKATFSADADSEAQQSKNRYFLESADKISYFYEETAVGPKGELIVEPHLSLNKIGHALHELNDTFRGVTFDERVKEVAFQLGFEEPAVVQSMYIFKNPKVGGEVKYHQDASYLYTAPPNLVGLWIALDDATLDNGCLWFASGSHKSGVHRRYIRNPDKDAKDLLIYDKPAPFYQKSNFTPVPVTKGSCILIHGQVVHFSERNKTDKARNAYTFHLIEQKNTKYSEDNWLQLPEGKGFLNLYKN